MSFFVSVQPVSAISGPLGRVVVLALIAIPAACLLPWFIKARRRAEADAGDGSASGERPPYQPQSCLLSKAERSLYTMLRQIAGEAHCVFARTPLADLVSVPAGTRGSQDHLKRLAGRHVDFVVCDLRSMRPRVAVQLDHPSRRVDDDAKSSDQRDSFLDQVLDAAGIPLLRVASDAPCAPVELRELLAERLREADEAEGPAPDSLRKAAMA